MNEDFIDLYVQLLTHKAQVSFVDYLPNDRVRVELEVHNLLHKYTLYPDQGPVLEMFIVIKT